MLFRLLLLLLLLPPRQPPVCVGKESRFIENHLVDMRRPTIYCKSVDWKNHFGRCSPPKARNSVGWTNDHGRLTTTACERRMSKLDCRPFMLPCTRHRSHHWKATVSYCVAQDGQGLKLPVWCGSQAYAALYRDMLIDEPHGWILKTWLFFRHPPEQVQTLFHCTIKSTVAVWMNRSYYGWILCGTNRPVYVASGKRLDCVCTSHPCILISPIPQERRFQLCSWIRG